MRKRRLLSFLLAIMLMVTSINTFEIQGMAAEGGTSTGDSKAAIDLSSVTVKTDIVSNGNGNVLDALSSKTYTIDGIQYNNYSMYQGVNVLASTEQDAASNAIDGKLNSRWESVHGSDPQYLMVDLGNSYMLKDIAIYWENASAREYDVEVSQDGTNFQTLTSVVSNSGKRTDDIKLSQEISVRTVRINCKSRTTQYGDSIYEIGLYGSSSQKEVVSILSNLQVKDYYKYTGKYFIYFNEPEESSGYNVYIDDMKNPIKKIKSSGEYLTAKELDGLADGTHSLHVTNIGSNGEESPTISTKFTISGKAGTYTDIPQIYIYTAGSITSSSYHKTADVSVSVIDKDGGTNKDLFDSASNIKVRGNTTAGAPKKPWNIKLSGKKSILGMEKGKKWCLLANSFDKSLMRNSLVYDFGLQNGVTYTSQSRFVDIYINGKYNGNYLITEAVEAKTERVDIDAYNADNNDILLELGTRNEAGVDHFRTYQLSVTFDVNDPEKGDDLTDEQVDAKIARVREFLKPFESALVRKDYDEILKYMDEDTFIDFYIANELFKNVDFNFSSTRFYIKNDKIYAGPLWDFDLSSGNCKSSYYRDYYVDGVSYKGFYCQGMDWYKYLFKNPTFCDKLKERYKNLQYVIQNMYKNGSETTLSIDYLVNNYGESFKRNYLSTNALGAGWSLTNDDGFSLAAEAGWTTWQQPIEFLRSWLKNRNIWLCEQWGIDMNSAYEDSKPEPPTEPETPTKPETPTDETPVADNKLATFEYDGTNAIAGDDMTEYADPDNDYVYRATTGNGTMTASITGTNLKHIEWGDAADYGMAVPIIAAGSKNPWSPEAYVAYTFSTKNRAELTASVDVGGTKKGPANLNIGYYDADGKFQVITTYTIAKNKTMCTVDFNLPKVLENQDSVTIYVKLANTTNIGGNEMTDPSYATGGELAINNFAVVSKAEAPTKPDTPTESQTPTKPDTPTEPQTPTKADTPTESQTPSDPDTPTNPQTPTESEKLTEPGTTKALETTTAKIVTHGTTTKQEEVQVGKTKVKSASKKANSKKAKISLKKIKSAVGYQVQISKSKKFTKKNILVKKFVKKVKFTVKSAKIKNKKKLYVRARAYKIVNGKKCYGKWGKKKKLTIK